MAFDLSEVLKDVSRPDTGKEVLAYLPYASLLPDPKNGYSMDGLDELARSIELVGLQQPLRVKDLGAGSYGLISGHRRHAAIGRILKHDPGAFADGIPCIVEKPGGSTALRELQLLLGNADNRVMTPADQLRTVEGVSDCLRRLEKEGYQFPGRHREWIAKMIGMSNTRVARLQAIKNNLATSLLQYFNSGALPVTAAYRLSQESEQIQHDVFRTFGCRLKEMTEAQLEEAIARRKQPPKPDPHIKPAQPAACCDAETRVSEYLAKRQEEDDLFLEMLTQRAREFLAELSEPKPAPTRSEGIARLKDRFKHRDAFGGDLPRYSGSPKGLEMESLDMDSPIFRTWTEVYDMLAIIAMTHSAPDDYWGDEDEDEEPEEEPLPIVRWEGRSVTPPTRELLLLRTIGGTAGAPTYVPAMYQGGARFTVPITGDELPDAASRLSSWIRLPDPTAYGEEFRVAPPEESGPDTPLTAEWQDGDPPRAGRYWCLFLVGGNSVPRFAHWRDDAWHFDGIDATITTPCLGWWPIPGGEVQP